MKTSFLNSSICLFQSRLPLTASCSGLSTICQGHFQTARDVTSDGWSAPHSRAPSQNAQTVIKKWFNRQRGDNLFFVCMFGLTVYVLNWIYWTSRWRHLKRHSSTTGGSFCTTSWLPGSSGDTRIAWITASCRECRRGHWPLERGLVLSCLLLHSDIMQTVVMKKV